MAVFYSDNEAKTWDVTGDDGTSRFSIVLLRVMTTAFILGSAYIILLLTGLFDVFSWPMQLQTLQMVTGIIIVFALFGLWCAISTHPLCGLHPKAFKAVLFSGYIPIAFLGFGYLDNAFNFVSDWVINPVSMSFGLPFLVAGIGLIPITRTAWTMSPRLTDD